jgi:hypothetical protein
MEETSVTYPSSYEVDLDVLSIYEGKPYEHRLVPTIRPDPDREHWLLYVTYTSGDSNGRYPGLYHEFVDLYLTRDEAAAAAKIIRDHYVWANAPRFSPVSFEKSHGADLPHGNGDTLYTHFHWCGYFEELVDIIVAPVTLNKPRIEKF